MGSRSVLIVEDEISAATALEIELTDRGYFISEVVCSSEDAIAQIAENKPALVLMDINIYGELDGIEAAQIIRAEHGIPVVFISGYSDTKTIEAANSVAHDGIVHKPFEIEALCEVIEKALAAR